MYNQMLLSFGGMFAMFLILPMVLVAVAVPVLIYVLARWRHKNEHADAPDTQLGLKVAIHLFRVLAFQLSLLGLFLFLFGVFMKGDSDPVIRLGIGVLIPAALLYAGHRLVATRTNDELYPNVRRMFDGWNLVQTGIPGMFSLIALFVVLIGDFSGSRGDMLRVVVPYLLTYFGAWGVLGFLWLRSAGIVSGPPQPGTGTVPPGGAGGGYDPNNPPPGSYGEAQGYGGQGAQGAGQPGGGGYGQPGGGGYGQPGGGGYGQPGGGGYGQPGGGGYGQPGGGTPQGGGYG